MWQCVIIKTKGEELELDYGPTLNRDNRTVKVWGIISATPMGSLVIYKGTFYGKRYLKMLEDHLL